MFGFIICCSSAAGVSTRLAGTTNTDNSVVDGFGTNAIFYMAGSVAVDSNLNVYVADFYFRKVSSAGDNFII